MAEITLKLWDDQCDFDRDDPESALFILCIDGVELLGVKSYSEIHKDLDLLFKLEDEGLLGKKEKASNKLKK